MSVMIDGAEALLADRKAEVVDYSNKNLHNYLVVIKCTLTKEERSEACDIVTATLENTSWTPTKVATQIKMSYDKSFGAAWQVRHSVVLTLQVYEIFAGKCSVFTINMTLILTCLQSYECI